MDIQTPLIFVSLFSLASVLLIFIYKFGIKEKSYEEALAEQRHQTHMLLGIKPKSKEKKNKKTSKKIKEKTTIETDVISEAESTELVQEENHQETHQKKLHVEFKEEPEESPIQKPINKKQNKKDKVRPILVHKDKVEKEIVESVSTSLNHFEELHPKDEYELIRSNTVVEEEPNKEPVNEKPAIKVENKKQEASAAAVVNGAVINGINNNLGKEKKKKKSEFNTLQQLVGDSSGPNMSVLLSLVRKAEMSRSEVQILIDLLLNKQHEAPVVLDEWSEGKSDPVQKLKKQLAEKEKLLIEEQQIASSAQSKLREIRLEHQAEKSQLQQKLRNLDEMFQTKQVEATRLHQQLQQLQTQIQEEIMKNHKLREEQTAIQMQRQQIELRLAQAQESEVMITQLQSEVQEISSINNQLRVELDRLSEENLTDKNRNQALIAQLTSFQAELEQKTEHIRQLEENRLDLERNMEKLLKQENDYNTEISRLNNVLQQQNEEIRKLELGKKQYQDELQKQNDEANKIITQLSSDLQKMQQDKIHTQVNGALQESKQHEIEILNLHNELTSIKTQLSQTEKKNETEIKAANALVESLKEELKDLYLQLAEEKSKLDEQKLKNNDLRTKNWKVMEALTTAENRLKSQSSLSNSSKSHKEVQKEFIQRLFPEIKELETVKTDSFEVDSEKYIRKYIEDLRQQQTVKGDEIEINHLKAQLKYYKNVIDDTEKMLDKLQKHIEQEEINWRMQLAAKTAELEAVKEKYQEYKVISETKTSNGLQ